MIYHKLWQYKNRIFLAGMAYLLFFSINLLYNSIPDELYVVEGEDEEISFQVPVSVEKQEESVEAFFSTTGKITGTVPTDYTLNCKFLDFFPVKEVAVHVVEPDYVLPSGMPIGIYTKTQGILIIGTGKVTASDGLNYEPAHQLVHGGDYITSVNGKEVMEKEELMECIAASGGKSLVLGIYRDSRQIKLKLTPVMDKEGNYKLGIWVRDDMAGVGTMTYVEEDMSFGALGHPISDADTGTMLETKEGKIYKTSIVGIVKGEDGVPGELTGVINYKDEYCIGEIQKNTRTGIYGKLNQIPGDMSKEYMEIGMKQNIKKGKAYILSSLDGTLRKYEIEIDDVDYNSKEENKGILFHVTDQLLLQETGGIVQGMSGSPIIQNDRLIGAVTHVFISDASKGYGVFIEKMLKQ
ncbi:MAG: SpoIVB peptidase [Roseburia sp.]|nr:SpoIVB peptidase [Roseburia sp.]